MCYFIFLNKRFFTLIARVIYWTRDNSYYIIDAQRNGSTIGANNAHCLYVYGGGPATTAPRSADFDFRRRTYPRVHFFSLSQFSQAVIQSHFGQLFATIYVFLPTSDQEGVITINSRASLNVVFHFLSFLKNGYFCLSKTSIGYSPPLAPEKHPFSSLDLLLFPSIVFIRLYTGAT